MFDFSGVKKLLGDAGASVRAKRAELETLRRERDVLAAAPLSKDDAVKALHGRIDEAGSGHLKVLSGALRQMALKGCPTRIDTAILAVCKPDTMPTMLTMEAAICLVFADQMKAAASRIVEAMEWPEGAMDHRDKTERLAKLDARIASVESDVRGMVQAARAAGISI